MMALKPLMMLLMMRNQSTPYQPKPIKLLKKSLLRNNTNHTQIT